MRWCICQGKVADDVTAPALTDPTLAEPEERDSAPVDPLRSQVKDSEEMPVEKTKVESEYTDDQDGEKVTCSLFYKTMAEYEVSVDIDQLSVALASKVLSV